MPQSAFGTLSGDVGATRPSTRHAICRERSGTAPRPIGLNALNAGKVFRNILINKAPDRMQLWYVHCL